MVIAIDLRALMSGNVSGVETYTRSIVQHLLKADQKNTYVLYLNSAKAQEHIFEYFSAPNIKTNIRTLQTKIPNRIFNSLLVFFRRPKLDLLIKKHTGLQPDIFFIPDLRPVPLSKKCRKIMVLHDLAYAHFPHFFSLKTKIWYKFIRPQKELKESDQIIVVSKATQEDLIETYKLPREKITVIHEGIPENFCEIIKEEVKNKYRLPEKYFLLLSTLEPRKNIKRTIEAFKIHKAKNPASQMKLVLAGKKNPEIFSDPHITEDPDIIFTGFIEEEDKAAVYLHAGAFLYPSLFEGFGIPLLEAMKCGTPIITSDHSSMPEVVGEAALTINPESAEAIASAMEKILDPQVQKNLKEKMAARIKHFSWEKAALETLKIISPDSYSPGQK